MSPLKKPLPPEEVPHYNNIELFPTLVWQINLGDTLSDKGKKVIKDSLKDSRENPLGNRTSKDSYVLEHPDLKEFKDTLLLHTRNYFDYTQHPPKETDIYITQSWTNLTRKNEMHAGHSHANSLVSAVYYHQTNKDMITFYNVLGGSLSQLLVASERYDKYNAQSWVVDVKDYDLLIFPSKLSHSVPKKESTGDRISLAYNTFFKGSLGTKETLTELKVNDWEELGWNRIEK